MPRTSSLRLSARASALSCGNSSSSCGTRSALNTAQSAALPRRRNRAEAGLHGEPHPSGPTAARRLASRSRPVAGERVKGCVGLDDLLVEALETDVRVPALLGVDRG